MKSPYFTKKGKYSLTLLTVSCLLLCIPRAITQADLLTEARELSYNGNYQEADSLFRKLIAADSLNTEAILGSAYNKSWHEHREEALIEFGKVLKIDPKNKSAFIGLGYTLAWNKDYANAKYPFLNALSLYPKDPEAEKGLAYVYLWQGSPDVALEMFANLNKRDPSDAEYYVALALAHIQKYETIEARKLLDKALMIDPANTAATDVKSSLRYASPMVELDIWGGYSHINTSSRFGLRNVQISVQVSRSLRALLTYDNALSLDNLFFINKNYNAETFMAGGIMSWNKSNISRLQSGYRNLDAQGVQWLLSGEHSISFNDHKILKAGGLYGFNQNLPDEWMMYGGTEIAVSKRIRIIPVYYFSHHSFEVVENRLSLAVQWRLKNRLEIITGGYFGKIKSTDESPGDNKNGVYISALIPIDRKVWLQAQLRRESSIAGISELASLGVKVRFEK